MGGSNYYNKLANDGPDSIIPALEARPNSSLGNHEKAILALAYALKGNSNKAHELLALVGNDVGNSIEGSYILETRLLLAANSGIVNRKKTSKISELISKVKRETNESAFAPIIESQLRINEKKFDDAVDILET